jgi:hypothetical protein
MTNQEFLQDQMATLEMQMRNALSAIKIRQWFSVDHLIEMMDICSLPEGQESLAPMVFERLIKWNWYYSNRGWSNPSFVRRERETQLKIIRPIGGRMFGTRASWPLYGDPSIRDRKMCTSKGGSKTVERLREKVLS